MSIRDVTKAEPGWRAVYLNRDNGEGIVWNTVHFWGVVDDALTALVLANESDQLVPARTAYGEDDFLGLCQPGDELCDWEGMAEAAFESERADDEKKDGDLVAQALSNRIDRTVPREWALEFMRDHGVSHGWSEARGQHADLERFDDELLLAWWVYKTKVTAMRSARG